MMKWRIGEFNKMATLFNKREQEGAEQDKSICKKKRRKYVLLEEDWGAELETIAISDSSTPNRRADRELLNTGGAYGKLHGERSPGKEPNQGRAVCKLPTNSGSPTTGSSALLQLPVLEQRSSVGRRRPPGKNICQSIGHKNDMCKFSEFSVIVYYSHEALTFS